MTNTAYIFGYMHAFVATRNEQEKEFVRFQFCDKTLPMDNILICQKNIENVEKNENLLSAISAILHQIK